MRNPFKIFSFQATFFTSFLIISTVLTLLLGLTSYYITNQEIVQQTISSRRMLLNEINKQLDFQLQSVEYDSLALATNPRLIAYLQATEDSFEHLGQNADIVDMLSRLSYVKEGIHSVQLYAKNTSVNHHIAGNGVYQYNILLNSSWYGEIKDADDCWVGKHVIEVESYPADEGTVISFARKVLSPAGKEIGILVLNLKMSFLRKLASGSEADNVRFILDTKNRLVADVNDGSPKLISYESIRAALPGIMERQSGAGADHSAITNVGEKALIIWNQQNRTLWVTMDVIPWHDITKGSRRIEKIILMVVLLCIIFAIAMAYLLSKQFVLPIRRLIQSMNVMKTGNLDVRVPNDYQNEFGRLNENFNQMTGRIDQLLVEVNDQNRRKREAEIRVLQAQINPHFLYNTLDMMNWHAIESGAKDISHMLALLGKMLRIGLSSGATMIPVQRELEHLHCYTELQKIRYRHTIQFEVSVPESLGGYYIPKLILQPFVENALLHGLHAHETGMVRISGWEDETSLYFMIEDDGDGMSQEMTSMTGLASMASLGRKHTGIRNVHERIQMYFGEPHGVTIYSQANQGTKVILLLPKLMSEPPNLAEGDLA
ncbi:cache domain-containing sensor histidine kinase [Paenibacillus ferrarius]|uniref:cache domain-containing sensor histidine kinase n=1 Tax=Paenibacillus ferrarius TaxID=1469647 RepID=UPI003D28E68D